MVIALRPVRPAEKNELRASLDTYLVAHADLVDPQRRLFDPADYPHFDLYWTDRDRLPLWIIADRQRAGFMLLNTWSPSGVGVDCAIAEFYVAPGFRRNGIGARAAQSAFNLKSGWWEFQVYRANLEGMAFWPRVLDSAKIAEHQVLVRDDLNIHRFRVDGVTIRSPT